jgi:hypothetical protein
MNGDNDSSSIIPVENSTETKITKLPRESASILLVLPLIMLIFSPVPLFRPFSGLDPYLSFFIYIFFTGFVFLIIFVFQSVFWLKKSIYFVSKNIEVLHRLIEEKEK